MDGFITKHSAIAQILDDFGNEMQQSLKAALLKDNAYVSGDLAEQIEFPTIIQGQGFLFQLKLKKYYDYVNKGVKGTKSNYITNAGSPYSYMESSKIPFYFAKQWMNNKGIFVDKGTTLTSLAGNKFKAGDRNNQAFLMARSWKEKGVKGNHFYDETVTEARLDKLKKDLALAAAGDLKIVLTGFYKESLK